MAIPAKITNFLDKNKIKYEVIKHKTVYTAFDKAATLRVPPKIIGKTLVIKLDPIGKPSASNGTSKNTALVLIPANKNLDKQKLKKIAKTKSIEFVTESSMKKIFEGINSHTKRGQGAKGAKIDKVSRRCGVGVKIGAVPPFGSLWKLQTFVDRGLVQNPKIIVNSGDYNFSLKISPAVLKKIPDLVINNFSVAKK